MRQTANNFIVRNKTIRKRQRGVVFIEGLLAIGILFIILSATRFLLNLHQKTFEERAAQRACAWVSAYQGCSQPELSRCAQLTIKEEELSDDEQRAIEDAQKTGSDSLDRQLQTETQGLKRRVLIDSRRRLQRPKLLGGKIYQWQTHFSLPCNPDPQALNISPEGAFREFN